LPVLFYFYCENVRRRNARQMGARARKEEILPC